MKPPAPPEPRMDILHEKKLIGKRLTMTLAENRTVELWRSFMPHRKEIKNSMTTDLFSVQLYEPSFDFVNFDQFAPFEKWAAMEVSDDCELPPGMERLCIKEGTYAVFFYKGAASGGAEMFRHIFETWLPVSGFDLDNRPHFELLGDRYKNDDPESEEEIWIPVKGKGIKNNE